MPRRDGFSSGRSPGGAAPRGAGAGVAGPDVGAGRVPAVAMGGRAMGDTLHFVAGSAVEDIQIAIGGGRGEARELKALARALLLLARVDAWRKRQ